MKPREVVFIYLAVALALYSIEISIYYLVEPLADAEINPYKRVSEAGCVISPCIIACWTAVRARQSLSDSDLLAISGWCLLGAILADLVDLMLSIIVWTQLELDTSWISPALVPIAIGALAVRYASLYLIIWLMLRFPGRWLSAFWLRRSNVAA